MAWTTPHRAAGTGVDFATAFCAFEPRFRRPLRWQVRLYDRFLRGDVPSVCRLPTGLGKTSVISIWLIALANGAPLARRLVYVINRRTVVDQATDLATQLFVRLLYSAQRDGLKWREEFDVSDLSLADSPQVIEPHLKAIASVRDALACLSGDQHHAPLAVSTLRGELADNRQWRKNPARPAIIIGTVDMIGSKLLFSGYGDGRVGRAHHAGLLGQDALIIHDEAHLTPAFSALLHRLRDIQAAEQQNGGGQYPFRPVQIMELSATSRSDLAEHQVADSEAFRLQDEDEADDAVRQRLCARKHLSFVGNQGNDVDLAQTIVQSCLQFSSSRERVLVYVRKPETALQVAQRLQKKLGNKSGKQVILLTGTIRGYQRDRLAASSVFKQFLTDPSRQAQLAETVYLISTSAGEVGVDLDADHLICDLTTLDGMIQRFGRVNRLGVTRDNTARESTIRVVCSEIDAKDPLREPLQETAGLLRNLPCVNGVYDASPRALNRLQESTLVQRAFTPRPEVPELTDIVLDAWSLTSVDALPGRPTVASYLHGIADWEPPETFVAWRSEVGLLARASLDTDDLTAWFEACPILAHERLRDRTDRVREQFAKLVKELRKNLNDNRLDHKVILLDERGNAGWRRLSELAERPTGPDPLAFATIVLPVEAKGLSSHGMLDASATESPETLDVAEELPQAKPGSARIWQRERWLCVRDSDGERWIRLATGEAALQVPSGYRERIRIRLNESGEEDEPQFLEELVLLTSTKLLSDEPEQIRVCESLRRHVKRVVEQARRLTQALGLPDELCEAVELAARLHDAGKARRVWQRYARCSDMNEPLAKSEQYGHARELGGYRHEFGSLFDAHNDPCVTRHPLRDLILHLVAAHHGWGRPHFQAAAYDTGGPMNSARTQPPTTRQNNEMAVGVVQRFGRLQHHYGRWGLAWLESILRCADAMASEEPLDELLTNHNWQAIWRNNMDPVVPQSAQP